MREMYVAFAVAVVCVWMLMRARKKTAAQPPDVESAESEGEGRFRVFQTHSNPSLRKVHFS